ncbi:MAG: DUF819 family protein [Saprospiraceae bacterium]|nr:DUF819 family protein [Saprospiraceae bacterium]
MWDLLSILILAGFPALSYLIQKRSGYSWLSPVLLCYATGILLANVKWFEVGHAVVESARDASILLGIPLLLIGTDFPAFQKQAKNLLLAFGLCVLSGIVLTIGVGYFFKDIIEQIWIYSGMLIGVYTGGIPNMNLIGLALKAPDAAFIYLNGADIVIGGFFLLLLLSIGKQVYGYFLKAPILFSAAAAENLQEAGIWPGWRSFFQNFGLSILITSAAVGITLLLSGSLEQVALLLLLLTTISLALSFIPKIRFMPGSFSIGEYFLLVFSVAIGLLADFSQIETKGLPVFLFTACVLFLAAGLHVLLCRLFRIDRDTAMITATAAFYGPPFVPQIASTLQNPGLIFPGILCGLCGFAIGNYLGISLGSFLAYLWA